MTLTRRSLAFGALAVASIVALAPAPARAQSDFYKGKTVSVVIGARTGSLAIAAQIVAHHLSKYIPGNPQIIIENQPGAATLIAAKNVFQARPDGLTIGNFIADIALGQLLNQPGVDFDFQKFEWIGVPVRDNIVCAADMESSVYRIAGRHGQHILCA